MNITVVYGNMDKTSAYNCVHILLNCLRFNTNINIKEFFLPEIAPHGGTQYHSTDKIKCNRYVDSIVASLISSDLIVLASPVSMCDISNEMNLFLKDIFNCIGDKKYSMPDKIGLAVCTSAGAGLFRATKTLKQSLNSLGINNTFKFSKALYELNWKNVNIQTKKQIKKKMLNLSFKILTLHSKLYSINSNTFCNNKSSNIDSSLKNNYTTINLNYRKIKNITSSKHL